MQYSVGEPHILPMAATPWYQNAIALGRKLAHFEVPKTFPTVLYRSKEYGGQADNY